MRRSAGARVARRAVGSFEVQSAPRLLLHLLEVALSAGSVAWRLAARSAAEQAWPAAAAAAAGLPNVVATAQAATVAEPAASPASQLLARRSIPCAAPFSSLAATGAGRHSLLPLSAAVSVRSHGLAAALDATASGASSHAPQPPLFHRAALYHSDSRSGLTSQPAASSSRSAPSHGGTAVPGISGASGPAPHFQRWLDGMRQQGFSVEYDPDRGKIEVKNPAGRKLDLYVRQQSSSPLRRKLWMVGVAAAFGATLQAAGPMEAGAVLCALAFATMLIFE